MGKNKKNKNKEQNNPTQANKMSASEWLDSETYRSELIAALNEKGAEFIAGFVGNISSNAAEKIGDFTTQRDALKAEIAALEKTREDLSHLQQQAHDAAAQIKNDAQRTADEIKSAAQEEKSHILKQAQAQAVQERQKKIEEIDNRDAQSQLNADKLQEDKHKLSEDRLQLAQEKLALEDARVKNETALMEFNLLKDEYNRARERFLAAQSQTAEIEKLKNSLQEASARCSGLEEHIRDQQNVMAYYQQLELELGTEKLQAADVAQYIERLEKEKNSLQTQLDQHTNDLEQKNAEIAEDREKYQLLQQEVQALRLKNSQIDLNKRFVEVSQAICRNLMEDIEKLKNALANHLVDPSSELSGIDAMSNEALVTEKQQGEEIKNLAEMVQYVCQSAAALEDPLYYETDDIRAFVAGLAVSRLLILQGMSGTGKSSLPRVFAHALGFDQALIAVESSWRDRNDLLGYYNDFSKQFNAKTFTKRLYTAAVQDSRHLNRPYFITLDEMNLARIEYYFSDFLAILQNPDPATWELELCAKKLWVLPAADTPIQHLTERLGSLWEKYKQGHTLTKAEEEELLFGLHTEGWTAGPNALVDGNRIKIPSSVWFIGTANRDESTFEITDKVYDRAQVLSLDEKAHPVPAGTYIPQRYISNSQLLGLFRAARQTAADGEGRDIESGVKTVLQGIDRILKEEFDVSFGNRIEKQAVNFAKVFVAAGGTLEKALDYQISTKLLRKIANSDNKDGIELLKMEFEKSGASYSKSIHLLDRILKRLG